MPGKNNAYISPDFEGMEKEGSSDCNILSPALCQIVTKDTYTIVLTFWAMLQLFWVSMLLFVQLVQISRAMTTYENMRGAHHGQGSSASTAITTALAAGTLTAAGAQLDSDGHGPDPALGGHHHHHHARPSCFSQWRKILGIDTFLETALHGYEGNRNRSQRNRAGNPFSRGCVTNCKDFLCDPAPVFGKRESGTAMLGGQVVNYMQMYETPPRMMARPTRGARDAAGAYEGVAADDADAV